MSDALRDASRLQAELAQLRTALQSLEAPAPDEAALRAQFREAQRRARGTVAKRAGGGAWRLPLAAAAAVVLACGGTLAVFLLRNEGASPTSAAIANEAPEAAPPIRAFQPLLSSPGLPSSSYSVVRVRIPLSAFAVVPGTAQGGTIEADLLVGEDGLARAIRFSETDLVPVSVADQ